jgi:hypothetical protein
MLVRVLLLVPHSKRRQGMPPRGLSGPLWRRLPWLLAIAAEHLFCSFCRV